MIRGYTIATILILALTGTTVNAQKVVRSTMVPRINCDEVGTQFCLDRAGGENYEGKYVGHDEPSILFLSSTPGSGNNNVWYLILPTDPPTPPKQNGQGGTPNFMLHPAFWLGMAMCDDQSAPAPTLNAPCIPNSDANIFNSSNRLAPDYIGKHPGAAFMEMQFYPGGGIDAPQLAVPQGFYFAAMNIFSLSLNMNKNLNNNADCLNQVGQEPDNFAVITRNGVPISPANPLGAPFGAFNPDLNNVLVFQGGDQLRITMHDSPAGFEIDILDLTTGQSGFMVAGPASGFGQVHWNPSAATCTVDPHAFHPMYATSGPSTTVPWAVHTYNVAFSDEIGHFELCDDFNKDPNSPKFLTCTSPGPEEKSGKLDDDDFPCANPSFFGFPAPFFPNITACFGEDLDFDGQSYGLNWPGTSKNGVTDAALHAQPIMFTSPVFNYLSGKGKNYDTVSFEADVPDFEPGCDVSTGGGCQLPPAPALFYPFFSTTTTSVPHTCWWQFGGGNLPQTVNKVLGTDAHSQFGPLSRSYFPTPSGAQFGYFNFRQDLSLNPCQNLGLH
jgi:hypothetical protein